MAYRDEVLKDNPNGYWRIGETVGTSTMTDSSPNGKNGTYDATNPPTLGQASLVKTQTDTCGTFNGTNQKSAVPDDALFDLVNSFTLEAWVTLSSTSAGEHRWLGKGTVGANGYSAGRTAANPSFFNMGVAAYTFSSVTLAVGPTYHMVFVFDAAQDVTLWLDGTNRGTVTGTSNITPGSASLFVGVSDSAVGGEFWDGKIDEVAVYGSILTGNRIQTHYSAGSMAVKQDPRPVKPIVLNRFSPLRSPTWPSTVPKVDVVSGGATFPQAMDATAVVVTATIATALTFARTLTATAVAVTASMVKTVLKNMSGTAVAATGTIKKQVNKTLAATSVVVTATLTALKVILKAMTATTVVVTASMQRQVNKLMTATSVLVTAARQLQVNKRLTATTVAVTATLQALKVIVKAMTATAVVVTASMSRKVFTNLSATVAVTGSVVKTITSRLTASVAVTGSMVASFIAAGALTVIAGAVSIADTILNAVGLGHSDSGATAAQDASSADASGAAGTGAATSVDSGTGADVTIVEPPH